MKTYTLTVHSDFLEIAFKKTENKISIEILGFVLETD